MTIPIIEVPGDRLAHSLGVPVEFMAMEADAAGLADTAKYAGGATTTPPEFMHHETTDSVADVLSAERLPPEFGMKRIPKMKSSQPLLPGWRAAEYTPETHEVKRVEAPMPRNEMTDVYPAIDQDQPVGDPVFLPSDKIDPYTGDEAGIYSTFVSGALSDTPPQGVAPAPIMRAPASRSGLIGWALDNKVQATVTVAAAYLFYKHVISRYLTK